MSDVPHSINLPKEQADWLEERVALEDDEQLDALAELGHETQLVRAGLGNLEYQARKRATRCNGARRA